MVTLACAAERSRAQLVYRWHLGSCERKAHWSMFATEDAHEWKLRCSTWDISWLSDGEVQKLRLSDTTALSISSGDVCDADPVLVFEAQWRMSRSHFDSFGDLLLLRCSSHQSACLHQTCCVLGLQSFLSQGGTMESTFGSSSQQRRTTDCFSFGVCLMMVDGFLCAATCFPLSPGLCVCLKNISDLSERTACFVIAQSVGTG